MAAMAAPPVGPSGKGIPPPPAPILLGRYKPVDMPTFHLYIGDILQFQCDTLVVVTDDEMLIDYNTPYSDGGNRCRPGHFSWRILANNIPVPVRVPGAPRESLLLLKSIGFMLFMNGFYRATCIVGSVKL